MSIVVDAFEAVKPRAQVEYRFVDEPGPWALMLGLPGESFESAVEACRRQFSRAIECRERQR